MDAVRPLGWWGSLLALVGIAGPLYLTHYVLIPAYVSATGQPYLVGFLIGWVVTVTAVFVLSLVAFRLEGRPLAGRTFSTRYRLDRMPRLDWLWALVVIGVVLATYLGLSWTGEWLAKIPFLAPHPLMPPDMQPGGVDNLVPGRLFGMQLAGQWWLVPLYLFGWVMNILGEEFWYRGWMLPRQEAAFGRRAWAVNGAVFALQHTMQPWNILAILPGSLFAAWVVQRRRNTWLTIIQHGLMNLGLFVFLVQGVAA